MRFKNIPRRKIKLGKATAPGNILVELLEALEDYGIDTKSLTQVRFHQASPKLYMYQG